MDNKKNIINVVLFIILILASDAIAYEPPDTSVKDAILNGYRHIDLLNQFI